jgi:glycerol-3-phosphate dehydrogenase subunit C
MEEKDPEKLARRVVDLCADCEVCRDMLEDSPCLFFPKLYRLYDRERAGRGAITSVELKRLVDFCNLCGICSCHDVRVNIMNAKGAFIARDGVPPAIRLLEDVERIGKLGGAHPRLAKLFFSSAAGRLTKRLLGIHPDRAVPDFAAESLAAWVRQRGLDQKREGTGRKVAYFAGCTARYLFPQVAKATIEILEHNGVTVFFPEQKCCGMPSLLEGDRPFTLELVGFNLKQLGAAVDEGYDIVCSCPSCGYLLKQVLCEGAFFSQAFIAAYGRMMREPRRDPEEARARLLLDCAGRDSKATAPSPRCNPPNGIGHFLRMSADAEAAFAAQGRRGFFNELDAQKRIAVASHTYDLGEYLRDLDHAGAFDRTLGPVRDRMAYYPPCHLKEQRIGEPWFELLGMIPGIAMERVGGPFDCCGMSGIMGFKREFHKVSLAMGARLAQKIREKDPQKLICDCLSCRIQFNQMLPIEVRHPAETLKEAYANAAR